MSVSVSVVVTGAVASLGAARLFTAGLVMTGDPKKQACMSAGKCLWIFR